MKKEELENKVRLFKKALYKEADNTSNIQVLRIEAAFRKHGLDKI